MRKVKIAIYQSSLKSYLPKPVLKLLKKKNLDFFVLPEYFFFKPLLSLAENPESYSSQKSEELLKQMSLEIPKTVLIGGSMITRNGNCFYNTTIVMKNGIEVGRYYKQRLFEREVGKICTGNESKVFEVNGIRFSLLICADVLDEGNFEVLSQLKPHVVFVPTFSPYKKESIEDKISRDEKIFVSGSKKSKAIIVKVCGVPDKKLTYPIQGRSLIANEERVLWRTPFHMENQELLKISVLRIK